MATPPKVRYFLLKNEDNSDTIFPWVFDDQENTIWKGDDHLIAPGSSKTIDLGIINPKIPNQKVVILGNGVQGKADSYKDTANKRTYVKTSQDVATGNYKGGKFDLNPASQSSLDIAAIQEAYGKVNSAAVAKLLVAIAGLISPEL